MESPNIDTPSIRDEWGCRNSSTQSKRRNFSSIATIRIGWWADLMECFCYLRNVQDIVADGKTPYVREFGEPFKGPIIHFGAMVQSHPISARDQARLHQFGKNVLPVIFFGYVQIAGGILEGKAQDFANNTEGVAVEGKDRQYSRKGKRNRSGRRDRARHERKRLGTGWCDRFRGKREENVGIAPSPQQP